jgi:hypothetical protein
LRAESTGEELDWRVTRMRLSKDKASLIYNQFLPLGGIPPETYEYRLGNRSALEWVIDQYQISGWLRLVNHSGVIPGWLEQKYRVRSGPRSHEQISGCSHEVCRTQFYRG